MQPDLTPISLQESFCFACHPAVPCFNECCRDLNQFLTPYDIFGKETLEKRILQRRTVSIE